uniref:WGS project CBMI000000000 data, contig CS3069_c003742 n=1 Tax=Fusarium clavum TaxID=2594811 RepID=A0A090MK18_9HYPO|nr:unnamed protein product [Fusarium clavum]CEG05922.1 unnamed protein product [Fusarium clavum]
MPESQGVVVQNGPNRITLLFTVDDQGFIFSGSVYSPIPPFSANVATLKYNDIDDLTPSNHSFHGQIGPETFTLTLDNGNSVIGDLRAPGVQPATTVSGSGIWQQN